MMSTRAWLADVLARLPGHQARRPNELLPWNWKAPQNQRKHSVCAQL
jgi:transposase